MLTPDDRKLMNELIRELRIRRTLDQKKGNWVKVSKVKELTGWSKGRLATARKNKEIEYRKDSKGIFYNIDSLAPVHKILQAV
jgi:hypothetical protein